MDIGFFIGVALLAWLNHYLAVQRGRNPIGWAIGGVFTGVLATILLLIIGKTPEKELEVLAEANRMAAASNPAPQAPADQA